MPILISCLVLGVLLFLLPRFVGRRHERMLVQYLILEKRFGLSRRVSPSRWGKGIGEHIALQGENRGYPLSLYSHYLKDKHGKTEWTSLVIEALFVGSLELSIEYSRTQSRSRFSVNRDLLIEKETEGCRIWLNDPAASQLFQDEAVAKWMAAFGKRACCGSVRLSNGFLEYREVGLIEGESQRQRFQEAILLLGSLCDALSVYVSKREAVK